MAVALAIVGVSLAHYLTSPAHFLLHNIFQRLYYVPILLACFWFGLRGGVLAAFACAAAYAPHIWLHWGHSRAYQASQFLELAMFAGIALTAGSLADRERGMRRRAEATADERDRALHDLEQTIETLRRADRLATLGTLAAGMAHEIRNPLGAIGGAIEILDADYPRNHPHREFLDILSREFERLNATAGRYLGYARPEPPRPLVLDVNDAVRSAVHLLSRSARRASIVFDLRLGPGPSPAFADAAQLHQALVNLLLNGIQAMPEGGALEIRTSVGGGAVEIEVRDHGAGLPEGPVERIFEPFFTTKPGGTGLGLAIARRIATAHGGTLRAERAEDGGARFRLALPAAPPSGSARP